MGEGSLVKHKLFHVVGGTDWEYLGPIRAANIKSAMSKAHAKFKEFMFLHVLSYKPKLDKKRPGFCKDLQLGENSKYT